VAENSARRDTNRKAENETDGCWGQLKVAGLKRKRESSAAVGTLKKGVTLERTGDSAGNEPGIRPWKKKRTGYETIKSAKRWGPFKKEGRREQEKASISIMLEAAHASPARTEFSQGEGGRAFRICLRDLKRGSKEKKREDLAKTGPWVDGLEEIV